MNYQEVLQGLLLIQNELLKIHTNGQDSFILVDSIKNLNVIIQYITENQQEKKEEE